VSKVQGKYYNSKRSKRKVEPFVEKYGIDISHWNIDDFKCFNDFFRRKKEINIDETLNHFISVADSKLMVYDINKDLKFKVKNAIYDIEDIVQSKEIAEKYENGYCLVFRLGVNDYHRYIYADNGIVESNYRIKGVLHTVRPISEKYHAFSRNSREVSLLKTETMGDMVQVEVGALLVGAIKNNHSEAFSKGDEKGYFEYGGSTIILLLENDIVDIDKDIIENSKKGIETKVTIGEKIGIVKGV
jgi:phosphatidylserine decarboxylase